MSSEMPVDASVGTPADGGRDAGPCWPPAMPRTRRAAGIDPPAGWSQVLSAPDGGPASRAFGVSVASAPDENGQPLIAAFRIDPNGDGHELDDDLVFTRWNGSSGSFEPLVTLEVPNRPDYALSRLVGEAHSIAVAQDVTTGRIGVAFASTNGLFLYVSDDEGRTFQLSRTRLNDATRPVLALRAGGLWLGYVAGPGDLHLEQGCGDSTLATSVYAPYALGFDAVGQPGLALIQQVPTDSYFDVGFLRPGSSVTPLYQGFGALLGSSGSSAAVAFAGTAPIVVTHQLLNGLKYPTEVPLIVSRLHESGGRTTTAQLQMLTGDGGTERTRGAAAVTVTQGGRITVAANVDDPNDAGCGAPYLAYSRVDAGTWDHCLPGTSMPFVTGGKWLSMWLHAPEKNTLVMYLDSRTHPTFTRGVVMYREP